MKHVPLTGDRSPVLHRARPLSGTRIQLPAEKRISYASNCFFDHDAHPRVCVSESSVTAEKRFSYALNCFFDHDTHPRVYVSGNVSAMMRADTLWVTGGGSSHHVEEYTA